MKKVYERYDVICDRDGLVDFGELLLRTVEVWRDYSEILKLYQKRFQHILVDEFQDTNSTQYAWIRLLAGDSGCVFAVGDDDQSIYGWRGAKVENIQRFQDDFSLTKPVQIIRLEQNYRSTQHILEAANAVISKNTQRLEKNLWTNSKGGQRIGIYRAINGLDEAEFVCDAINDWSEDGKDFQDCAVLYRSNAQSRVIEQFLLKNKIPYQVYGGLRFFERAEVKDVLAYAALISNPDNNTAFMRIINTPPRGIGAKAIQTLAAYANEHDFSMWQAAKDLASNHSKVAAFLNLMDEWRALNEDLQLSELIEHIVKASGLVEHYEKEGSERALTRKENLDELIAAAHEYQGGNLSDFLANTALDSGETEEYNETDKVQLMTLHAAKGLEFPLVFMIGVEDGILPTSRSLNDTLKLAEERRLTYVGITRAKEKLYILFAYSRQLYGNQFVSFPPSRFLSDLPENALDLIKYD